MAYDNELTGIISKNERQRNERDPSHTGQCTIDGREYWISAWIHEGKSGSKMAGKKFFSLAFKPKNAAPASPPANTPAPQKPAAAPENLDEDVPF